MDRHTFIDKRKVGSTDICDFTDYQGIGSDPLYKRYESVNSIIKKAISPEYAHFLAAPNYDENDDVINWYIEEWKETPDRYIMLEGEEKEKYTKIKNATIAHYKSTLNKLSGEDLQVMACVLRYILDDFIYCCDGKVYVLAWGMKPDTNKVNSTGELVHEAPYLKKYRITFNAGEHGKFATMYGTRISLAADSVISERDLPSVKGFDGYEFSGWSPNPVGTKVTSDMSFTATYRKVEVVPPVPPVEPPAIFEEDNYKCQFFAGDNGKIEGNSIVTKQKGERLLENEIPVVKPNKGYAFKGWSVDPLNLLINEDVFIEAIYEKKLPWYKKLWLWLTGKGCFKWLLWLLLIILLVLLILWLLQGCESCSSNSSWFGGDKDETVQVDPKDGTGDADGKDGDKGNSGGEAGKGGEKDPNSDFKAPEIKDDNGIANPIDISDGLPKNPAIVAPIRDEDGSVMPIKKEPGMPPIVGDRLVIFLENENANLDAFVKDFRNAYPEENKYEVIGYDRQVKSITIRIPEAERDEIRETLPSKIPNHKFFILDEELYQSEKNSATSSSSGSGWHLTAVKAQEAWNITKGDPSIIVAVVDDGIDATHPIFGDRIVNAYNVFTQNSQLSTGEGHGTHTAGLAVGSLDYLSKGAAGLAPNCKLMPIQVFDNGLCPMSSLVSGIMYAIHNGASVVNVSIGPKLDGFKSLPEEVQEQIAETQFKNLEKMWARVCKLAAQKKVIIVFSAGNDTILSGIPPANRNESAIIVGAVDQNLYPAEFSNYGLGTDISAPGVDIYSSVPVQQFQSMEGTSMSAPIVSGVVALMKSLKKDITVQQVRNVLQRTGAAVYGNMPPMVQANLALEAVQQGNFRKPAERAVTPVPGVEDMPSNEIPPSWSEPGQGQLPPGIGKTPERGKTPDSTNPSAPGNESDYDAIRRLIEYYEQKIADLKNQLPN